MAALRAVSSESVDASTTIESVCSRLAVARPRVENAVAGMIVSRGKIRIPSVTDGVTVAHALAHQLVPSIFPPHGAEFCEKMVELLDAFDPSAAEQLRVEFDVRGVHYNADHRKRAVIKAVIQRAKDGTKEVEAVFDGPPERLQGSFSYTGKTVTIGGETRPLDRLRYVAKVS